jgi:propanol-preferring alcohol dehydrogenase
METLIEIDSTHSMRAQLLVAFNTPYTLQSIPVPSPTDPYDVLIKVEAASYCHTDAVLAAGQMPPYPLAFPHVGCHEFAGTVTALSPNSASWLKIGDRVGVPGRSFRPCETCFECTSTSSPESPDSDPPGYSVYCPHSGNNGISRNGGFMEYAVVDGRQVALIPDGMSAVDTSVLMCAGLTIYAAIKRCGLKPGQRLGIMGCGGGLGHLGLQFAAYMGLKVVGVDNSDGPLQLAREIAENQSAIRIVDARSEQATQIVMQLGTEDGKKDKGDMGLDAVIILPESQEAFNYGMSLLRNHGRCIVVSFPEKGFHISARDVVFRDISILGSLVGSNKTLNDMLQFASKHNVKARVKTFPLSRLNDLVKEYHKGGGGKLVIDFALPDME